MKNTVYTIFTIFFLSVLIQCSTDEAQPSTLLSPNLPGQKYDYVSTQSAGGDFAFNNTPFDNHMTDAGATLGRVLFYDKQLSINNTVSCGTCHKQSLAFSDDVDLSVGFGGQKTTRNSPPIMNLNSSFSFFWDFSESSLENQVLTPIKNHVEMGMENLDYLEQKLANIDYYDELFKEAFGTTQISKERISMAMAQFIRSIVTFDSDFDQAMALNDLSLLSPLEYFGSKVFLESGCNSCHKALGGSVFLDGEDIIFIDHPGGYGGTGEDTANIGLDKNSSDKGAGNGSFKVPSLRNIQFTAPYMHDGRFKTLEEVVDHYDHGVKDSEFLDFRLVDNNGEPKRLHLNSSEKNALIAFLLTMTDTGLMTDPKYSDPFL